MKPIRILAIIVLAIIMFFTGAWCGIRFYSSLWDYEPYLSSAAQVTHAYGALLTLRKGETEATVIQLESSLNSGLIGLTTIEDMRDGNPKTQILQLLGKIKAYRKEYPFSQNEIIDDAIAKVLAFSDESKDLQQGGAGYPPQGVGSPDP